MKITRVVLVVALLVPVTVAWCADDRSCTRISKAELEKQGPLDFLLRLSGQLTSDGSKMMLEAELGLPFDRGAVVYSEPSHTFLLLALAKDYSESTDGILATADAKSDGATIFVSEGIRETAMRLQVPIRPDTDDRIAVSAIGEKGLILVADGRMGPGSFSFESYLSPPSKAANSGGGGCTWHCCHISGCLEQCACCDGPRFECCCYDAYCYWYGLCTS